MLAVYLLGVVLLQWTDVVNSQYSIEEQSQAPHQKNSHGQYDFQPVKGDHAAALQNLPQFVYANPREQHAAFTYPVQHRENLRGQEEIYYREPEFNPIPKDSLAASQESTYSPQTVVPETSTLRKGYASFLQGFREFAPKKPYVEQYLKEVTPTTKTAFSQRPVTSLADANFEIQRSISQHASVYASQPEVQEALNQQQYHIQYVPRDDSTVQLGKQHQYVQVIPQQEKPIQQYIFIPQEEKYKQEYIKYTPQQQYSQIALQEEKHQRQYAPVQSQIPQGDPFITPYHKKSQAPHAEPTSTSTIFVSQGVGVKKPHGLQYSKQNNELQGIHSQNFAASVPVQEIRQQPEHGDFRYRKEYQNSLSSRDNFRHQPTNPDEARQIHVRVTNY